MTSVPPNPPQDRRVRGPSFNKTMALIEAIEQQDHARAHRLTAELAQRGDMTDILDAVTAFGRILKRTTTAESRAVELAAALDELTSGSDKQRAAVLDLGRAALVDADSKNVISVAVQQRSSPDLSDGERGLNLLVLIKAAGRMGRELGISVSPPSPPRSDATERLEPSPPGSTAPLGAAAQEGDRHRGGRRWALVLIGVAAVIVALALALPGGLLHRTNRPSLGAAEATTLSTGLTSPSPQQRSGSVVPQLRTQVAETPILSAGTVLSINRATFSTRGDQAATVDATSTGTESGRWRLYLAKVNGTWMLADTVSLP